MPALLTDIADLGIVDELPIATRADEIAAALEAHPVVVVAGETGSGKTTQLPKLVLRTLERRRPGHGRVAHTQPRRLAARTVADRIADELGVQVGTVVGSRVRFSDRTSKATRLTLMTDGVLLAEISRDRLLRRYDAIIIDEAHERSLTIDFLLGYLATLLPRRPDLRVVVTSATIDPDRFARHFADVVGEVPVIEVSGRTYPVELRYRPFGPGHDSADAERDQTQAVLDAVDELAAEPLGDVLVFLSGEREIRDTADALREHLAATTDVLPLYARLSTAEQHRVFAPHGGRRIVLATNVAETSLTVPGIRYVVDAGTARISRYSLRTKVQRLPIEPVSQASANQRAGRCGRVADGVCIRLYSEESYAERPPYTDPEILRTNLAAVILQMADLGLGDIESFPFVDPPDRRTLRDGVALLSELGALEPAAADPSLTRLGRRMARLPVDPRLGRMVVDADRHGCIQEVLVITAGLSIQDPRERPEDRRERADTLHARFTDPSSDLMAYLNLWTYLQEQQRARSGSAFRRMCRDEHLHFLRVREWQDLVTQLRRACREIGIDVPERPDLNPQTGHRAPAEQIHRALLTGLLSHVGTWDEARRDYTGARGARFAINPGSALASRRPRWVMAAELVETSRVWARGVARVDPSWIESIAPDHLLVRNYAEPRWSRRRGSVVATESVSLYGLPVVAGRTVGYARVDPELCRELFIRHALVEGDWEAPHAFRRTNSALQADLAAQEERTRRRDILVDDEHLLAWYDARIPRDVVSARHFDSWWKKQRRTTPDLLTLTARDLTRPETPDVDTNAFPEQWALGTLMLAVSYRFEPGTPEDGVTIDVPLSVLDQVSPAALSWQVPGLRAELVQAMIRALPKALRRSFVPAPTYAASVLERLADAPTDVLAGDVREAVAGVLTGFGGPVIGASDIDITSVPDHLRVRVRVLDGDGGTAAAGRDLGELQRRLSRRVRSEVAAVAPLDEQTGLTSWSVGSIPRTVTVDHGAGRVTGYPCLVDEGAAVALRVLTTEQAQSRAMPRGVARLLVLDLPSPVRAVVRRLDGPTKLALSRQPYATVPALLDDAVVAAVGSLVGHAEPPWDESAYARLKDDVASALIDRTHTIVGRAAAVLGVAHEVTLRTSALDSASLLREDLEVQMQGLVFDGFLSTVGAERLDDITRYVTGMLRRLDAAGRDPGRDARRMSEVHEVEDAYLDRVEDLPAQRRQDDDVTRVRWMLEELRISVFAQQLGTPAPVSPVRIRTALSAL